MSFKILASTNNLPYEDWLEYRKLGIGGSDASVVCGISRYKSPVELWMEKTNQLPQRAESRPQVHQRKSQGQPRNGVFSDPLADKDTIYHIIKRGCGHGDDGRNRVLS